VSLLARLRRSEAPPPGRCRDCRHFENGAAALEAAFRNLAAMSSGHASVRDQDGICGLRQIYLPASAGCGRFARA
jgi:hypothetical protein